jgi:cellulose synthase/poly-beta-1,6-N-acetylglucosamine synthase-like glycosyltransferase
VRYVPEAISYGQATARWRDASQQRVRWYGGVVQLRQKYAGLLLKYGLRAGNLAALDRAVELLLPSFSMLAAATLALGIIQSLWSSLILLFPLPVTLAGIVAWILFPFVGLLVDRAPRWTYETLLYAPVYAAWRIVQGARATLRRGQVEWIRTRRREEQA